MDVKIATSGMEAFIKALGKENINAVLWKGKADMVYGITYIDHKTKSVFNGSELGKEYSAKAIVEKCTAEIMKKTVEHSISKQSTPLPRKSEKESSVLILKQPIGQSLFPRHSVSPFIDPTPNIFKKKKRKKRKISIKKNKNITCMQTGENEQGLRKIIDMTRLMSLVILGMHFYYYCYHALEALELRSLITDRIMGNIQRTRLFDHFNTGKY